MRTPILIVAVVLNVAFFQKDTPLTVNQILLTPKDYNGKKVTVKGYYVADFENSSLWCSKKMSESNEFEQSIWIGGTHKSANLRNLKGEEVEFGYFRNRYIEVTGRLKSERDTVGTWVFGHGHMNLWPAEISEIEKVKELSAPH